MTRTLVRYRCTVCAHESPKWLGRCPQCGEWGTLEAVGEADRGASRAEAGIPPGPARRRRSAGRAPPAHQRARARPGARRRSGRGLGHARRRRAGHGQEHARAPGARRDGGRRRALPPRVRRGIGGAGAAAGRPARHARARPPRRVRNVAARRVRARRGDAARRDRHRLDPGGAGSRRARAGPDRSSQVRDGAIAAQRLAKELGIATLLVGHVTKDGSLAGPRTLEHVVDTVLSFEGDRHHALRMLRALKHRFGPTDELGLMEMTGDGLVPVSDPSALFLADRRRRALPVRSSRPCSKARARCASRCRRSSCRRRRRCRGGSRRRSTAAGSRCSSRSCSSAASVVLGRPRHLRECRGRREGGRARGRPRGRAGDRERARRRPVAADTVVIGELGLGGEVRQVPQIGRRLGEAQRLGFVRAIVPASTPDVAGIQLFRVADLARRVPWPELTTSSEAPELVAPQFRYPRSTIRPGEDRGPAPIGTPLRRAAARRARHSVARRHRPDPPGEDGRADRRRRRARGAQHLLGRVPARRRVHAAAAVGARQDGRRDHPRLRRHPVSRGPTSTSFPIPTSRRPRPVPATAPPSASPARSRCRCSRCRRRWASCRCTTAGTSARSLRSRGCWPAPIRRCRSSAATRPALDGVTGALSALEVEDLVTLRDVATVLQRAEMVRRIADEIEGYVVELGDDGRLVELQLEELTGGVEDDRRLVGRDYFVESAQSLARSRHHAARRDLRRRPARSACRSPSLLGLPAELDLDSSVQPRGYRLLSTDPAPPGDDRRPRDRALRPAAEDHAREHLRSRRCRRRRRGACPRDQGRARPGGRELHPRPLLVISSPVASRGLDSRAPWALARRSRARRDRRGRSRWRSTRVDVPAVHARPDGMPTRGRGAASRHRWAPAAVRRHGPPARDPRPRGVRGRAVRGRPCAKTVRDRRSSDLAVVKDLDDPQQLEMLSSAADLLVVEDGVSRVCVLGFCMGGHYAFKAAASDRFDAAVAFYGMLRTPDGWKGPGHTIEPLAVADRRCARRSRSSDRVDPWTPAADIDALRAAWSGRPDCEIVVVEGADHGFVHDPDRPVHRADDAAVLLAIRAIAWIAGLDGSGSARSRGLRARRGRGCGTGCGPRSRASRASRTARSPCSPVPARRRPCPRAPLA